MTSYFRSITYHPNTLQRAERALCCSPFPIQLFQDMRTQGISILNIAGHRGVALGYSRRKLTELTADSDLGWLIQVGILRREVDGQGLTDSFRLTPLGLQIVTKWGDRPLPAPRKRDQLLNFLLRCWRAIL